jgi:hypothetical protein
MKNVWLRRKLGYIPYLRTRKVRGTDLSVCQSDKMISDVDVPLKYVKSRAMPGPTLVLRVNTISNIQVGEIEIANTKVGIAPLESRAAGLAALKVAGVVQSSDFMLVLGTLMESVLKIGDEFAKVSCLLSVYLHLLIVSNKIHPFSQVAWTAGSQFTRYLMV